MQITVNGKSEAVDNCSVLEFVQSKDLIPEKVVVELNGNIIKRIDWTQVQLSESDNLEVIALVGGG